MALPAAEVVLHDAGLARALAEEAGEVLLALREELGFADPAALRAAGDRRAHELLAARLAELRPDDAVLSEEGLDDPTRLTSERVWIVDPLDGTREYAEPGRSDWAVHVALWEQGRLAAGAVALPARGMVLGTDAPPQVPPAPAALQSGGRPADTVPVPSSAPRIAVSRTRPPAVVGVLVDALGAVPVPMGSAGVKTLAVALGEADAYVHAGGQYEWDSAAPVAVAAAAGLHTSRLDGSPLVYNRPDPLLPDLLVCRPELAPVLLHVLAGA